LSPLQQLILGKDLNQVIVFSLAEFEGQVASSIKSSAEYTHAMLEFIFLNQIPIAIVPGTVTMLSPLGIKATSPDFAGHLIHFHDWRIPF
jgi:hypothetical protein